MFPNALIFLRYFWMAAPAAGVAIVLAWMFWGMGFWLSVFMPLAAGAVAFFFLSLIGMAAHYGR